MRLLTGYTKPILALAFSPDGSRLYSTAKGQQQVWVWDVAEGKVARKLPAQRGNYGLPALAVSPDGRLVSAGGLTQVNVWPPDLGAPRELPDGAQMQSRPRPALALSPSGKLIAAACSTDRDSTNRPVRLWPTAGGEPVTELPEGGTSADYYAGVSALALAADAGPLACAFDDEVRLWSLTTRKKLRTAKHGSAVAAIAFRPGGEELASCCGKSVFVWDLKAESPAEAAAHGGAVTAVSYSPDGKYLASAAKDGVVILLDARTREVAGRKQLDVGALGALAWRHDSSGFAAGGDRLIALCGLADLLGQTASKPKGSGEPLSLAGHEEHVVGLAYSPDGRTLASHDGTTVHLWDLSGGAGQAREKAKFEPHDRARVRSLTWGRDGKRLAVWWPAQLHDGDTGGTLTSPTPQKYDQKHLAFLPSGRLVRINHLSTDAMCLHLSLLHEDGYRELASADSPPSGGAHNPLVQVTGGADGRYVYFSNGEKSAYRWDTSSGEVKKLFNQGARIGGLRVREDERLLATTGGNSALVWSLPDGARKADLKHPLACTGAAFLPGGRVITACYDGVVRLWGEAGGEIMALDLGMGKVYCLAVSPDHMTFAAGVHKKNRIVLMDVPE